MTNTPGGGSHSRYTLSQPCTRQILSPVGQIIAIRAGRFGAANTEKNPSNEDVREQFLGVSDVPNGKRVEILAVVASCHVYGEQNRKCDDAAAETDVAHDFEKSEEEEPIERSMIKNPGIWSFEKRNDPVQPSLWQSGTRQAAWCSVYDPRLDASVEKDILRSPQFSNRPWCVDSPASPSQNDEDDKANTNENGNRNKGRSQLLN